jgi:polysaccharide biosynthesis protein PslG
LRPDNTGRIPLLLISVFLIGVALNAPALAQGDSRMGIQTVSTISRRSLAIEWSRRSSQATAGYYDQPACLCEDYPAEDRTQERLDRDFAIIRWTGAKALRFGISWLDVEPERGVYDWTFWDTLINTAERNHIAVMPYVCYTPDWAAENEEDSWRRPPANPADFAQFMSVIAGRYRGKVFSWELWNEPDNRDFWLGSVDQYAKLAHAGAAAVRQADPGAVVVLGGMANSHMHFLKTLIDKYDIDQTVDVINMHGYFQTWNSHPIEDYSAYIDNVAKELHDPSSPDLWMAEFGYSSLRPEDPADAPDPTFYAYEHTPAYQAAMLFKSQVIALSTGELSLTAWYRIRDLNPETDVIGDDNNKFFGIATADGALKPAAYALRFYNELFDRPTRCIDGSVEVESSTAGSQAEVHVFRQHGRLIVIGWLRSTLPGELKDVSGNANDVRAETVSVILPSVVGQGIKEYDATGNRVAPAAKLTGWTLANICLDGESVFIATLPTHEKESVAGNSPRQ